MRNILASLLLLQVTCVLAQCGGDDDDGAATDADTDADSDADADADTDTDTDTDTDADTDTDTDADTDADSDADTDADTDADSDTGDQTIGSSCHCEGDGCLISGVPMPTGGSGTLVGCADVPAFTGGLTVCLQSYDGSMATHTWFANGYCGLMATACTPDNILSQTICDSAEFGDFANLDGCPAGYVGIEFSQHVTALSIMGATIDSKICARSCADDTVCRTDEFDALWDEATGYDCIEKVEGDATVKFCYDARNLPDPGDYTVTQY